MQKPDPSKRSSEVAAMAAEWPMISALLGGTTAMREAGTAMMPKWPNESAKSYSARLKSATLFPAFKRSVEVLAAKPFAEQMTLNEDVPPDLVPMLDNCDLQGRNLHSFAADVFERGLAYGMSGILVSFPPVKKGKKPKTRAEEKRAGLRPYLIHIDPTCILGWRSVRDENGVEVLTQLRLLEQVKESVGDFDEVLVTQVRVLYQTKWEVWRKNAKNEWQISEEGDNTLGKIAFVPFYAKRTGFLQAEPPLVDMAHLNVEHWQSKSDQQTILHVARVPILFAAGFEKDATITIGASSAVVNDNPLAQLSFVEHTGAAVEAGRQSLLDLEENMRQIGAELLVLRQVKATATQVDSEDEHSTCSLRQMAEDLEDAIDQALQLMAEWVKLPNGGHVSLYKDFGVDVLAEAALEFLREMSRDALLSKPAYFKEIQRRGIISPDLDYEAEQKQVAEHGHLPPLPAPGPAPAPKPVPKPAQ